MKYTLLHPVDKNLSTIQQILLNRGIPLSETHHYLNTTDADINEPAAFGVERLKAAAAALIKTISEDKKTLLIVDSDCDGMTSAALLINYLYNLFPSWTKEKLEYFIHSGKQHGLSDVEVTSKYALMICPDSSSNDYEYHKAFASINIPIIVLDHHEAEKISEDAIVINNQLSDYPNKELSGVGVTWQFCRYLDQLLGKDFANKYFDLVALGNMADMMSLRSIETKHLITKGFQTENIKNPFIYTMAAKNAYSLGTKITPMGAAFYIAPFVNSMVRSGIQEEKELLFKSMLEYEAFKMIPSNKRGHRPGEMERLVDQAVRTAVNVKSRQTRAQNDGLDVLEAKIKEEKLLDHKVLLLLLKPNQVDRNIAGLIANKFMAKYQRPCCILTRVEERVDGILTTSYQGSARGCDKAGITNFKDICEATGVIMYAEGHQGAFGLGIESYHLKDFIEKTDAALVNMSDEPIYFVDYIFKSVDVNPENILDIASLNELWGKDMDEAFVAIENLKVAPEMITLMSPDKKPTLKITLPNKVCLIKFGSSQEEYERFLSVGYIELNIVGKCSANEWNGWVTPQILIEDYNIVGSSRFNF